MSEDDPRPMKVHKVTLLVVDHDEIGEHGIRTMLETARYPGHAISPRVMDVETREVQWTDRHPLNDSRKQEQAFDDLFGDRGDRKP